MATFATSYDPKSLEIAVREAGVDFGSAINASDVRLALRAFGFESGEAINDSDVRRLIREYVKRLPDIEPGMVDNVAENIIAGQRTLVQAAQKFGGTIPPNLNPDRVDPGRGVTDVAPVNAGGSVIPQGAELIRVKNPKGSDEPFLYFLSYDWRGVKLTYEVGGPARFKELFGSTENFAAFRTVTQASFDGSGFVQAGSVDPLIGSEESIGSRIEREVRAQGLEDLPAWLGGSQSSMALVAEAAAQEWSPGRLWQELSGEAAFQQRYGAVFEEYRRGGNITIAEAVRQIEADEKALAAAIRPFADTGGPVDDLGFLHDLLNRGWTAGFAAQTLEQAEVLRRDPESLPLANAVLGRAGLGTLDEVGFLNALAGFGPQDVVETLNTATAARALDRAGIDLADEDIDLVMELVETSDRLLTAESWAGLAQELSLNLVRFSRELDQEKLGAAREDLIAAAFGEESPTGKSAGDVLSMVARFERDRRAQAGGFDQVSAFQDERGRLKIQGLQGI